MKVLNEDAIFCCPAKDLWAVISDFSRCDWVPTIEKITLKGNFRYFEMAGIGQITEKILECDHQKMVIKYTAVETPAPVEHHLARMKILSLTNQECKLSWITEIAPDIFADGIHQGMLASIEGIKTIL